jgi:predicted permease
MGGREQDLDREVRSHLDLEAEEQQESGLSPQEARYAALRAFGNSTFIKEVTREMWGWRSLERFRQDLQYALRTMRRSPGVTAVAVLSLALGIGANTAIFSLIDTVMLKTLPVENPEQLVLLGDGVSSGSMDDEPFGKWGMFSHPVYKELESRNQVFSGMLAFVSYSDRMFASMDRGEPELVTPKLVSGNYFSVLGVPALIGRTFGPDDDRPGAHPVAVLSYSYWNRRFARDPAVVGRTLVIRKTAQTGVMVQIAGVAPRGFFGEKAGASPEFWIPLSMEAEVDSRGAWLNNRYQSGLQMLGRLKPGVSEQQARGNIDTLFRQILVEYAGTQLSEKRRRSIERTYVDMGPASRGISSLRTRYSEPLKFLLALTGAVLLIACANIANLLLARATARQKEMAVRVAVGASRGRLLRQMLTESVVLASAGGVLGALFGWWASDALMRLVSGTSTPALQPGLNLRMLFFTGLVSLTTGLLFGLAPALRATRTDLQYALKEATGTAGGRQKLRLGRLLVVAQIAMTLLLVVSAGAFVRSLQNLRASDVGFERQRVLMFEIDPGQTGYNGAQLTHLYDSVLERINALPGVQSASLSRVAYSRGIWGAAIRISGDEQGHVVRGNFISPRYFETMGIPLLAGRAFGPQDNLTAPKAAIVNETLVRKLFSGKLPLGERFRLWGGAEASIIGVVKDFKYNHIRENVPPLVFLPYAQFPGKLPQLAVRTSADGAAVAAQVRQAIKETASSLPVVTVTKLSELVDRTLTTEQLVAQLAAFFGLLAILLACIGIYGILSYAVAGRTNEIGIRMALGARPQQVRWIVLRDMLRLVALGAVIGIAAAVAGERLVNNMLFGLKGTDPMTVVCACLLLLAVAMLAAYLPARRASRVDPLVALRYE